MISWGIIGCGDVTEKKSGPAFNKVPHSKLTAVMRRDATKAADYALRHGVPKWYSNADDLINDPDINAVYIATPPSSHEEYTIAALKAGKSVYVEKPVTTDVASCRRMIKAATKYKTKLTIAHYRRALPLFLKVKDLIEKKTIGKLKLIRLNLLLPDQSKLITQTETNWRILPEVSGGGLFYDLAPHQIDIILFICGAAKKYYGLGLNQSNLYGAEDFVSGIIHFEEGSVFSGNWCFTMPECVKEDSCEIIGENGSIKFSFFENNPLLLKLKSGIDAFTFERPEHIQQTMIQKVVNYFLDEEENPCSIEEALKSLEIMERFARRDAMLASPNKMSEP